MLSHIREQLPAAEIHYVADHAASPYGDKEEQWLVKRVDQLVHQMQQQIAAEVIIMACNTASTLALPTLRSHIHAPIVGVVPAIKTAAAESESKHIGLLATPATTTRTYIDDLIAEFAANCRVERLGTTTLVKLAEDKLSGLTIDLQQLADATNSLIETGVDTVVLGCTHFPLLLKELQQLYPHIHFVDSGDAIARRTQHLLNHKVEQPIHHKPGQYYSTAAISNAQKQQLTHYGFEVFTELDYGVSSTA